jgi:hypothetical protein
MSIPRLQTAACFSELEKLGGVPSSTVKNVSRSILQEILGGTGQYGNRLLSGALVGAGVGSLADKEDRVRGALVGALGGAGLLGAGMLATREGRAAAQKGLGRWWARQKYSLTGKGANTVEEARNLGIIPHLPKMENIEPGTIDKILGRTQKDVYERALRAAKLEEEAFLKGMHHIPGTLKYTVQHPIDAMRLGWSRVPTIFKPLLALSAYQTAKSFVRPNIEEEVQGKGRFTQGLGNAATFALGMVSPYTLAGMLLPEAGRFVASRVGKVVDRSVHPSVSYPGLYRYMTSPEYYGGAVQGEAVPGVVAQPGPSRT